MNISKDWVLYGTASCQTSY